MQHLVPINKRDKQAEACRDKRHYDSRAAAQKSKKGMTRKFGVNYKAYRCTVCSGWCLTTQKRISKI